MSSKCRCSGRLLTGLSLLTVCCLAVSCSTPRPDAKHIEARDLRVSPDLARRDRERAPDEPSEGPTFRFVDDMARKKGWGGAIPNFHQAVDKDRHIIGFK